MKPTETPQTTFRLGITMAGAVSAGAYTAGVLDYIFESLHLWEKLRKENPSDHIPPHRVIIEVMAGASAGSLCTALSLLALRDTATLDKGGAGNAKSILYQSWVEMNDGNIPRFGDTLEQMLRKKESGDTTSLLNTDAIDILSDRIVDQHFGKVDDRLPIYVSDHVEVIMTLTSLRGVRFNLGFGPTEETRDTKDAKPGHAMQTHKSVAHYVVDGPKRKDRLQLPLESKTAFRNMMEIAMASGAFPIGLRSRTIKTLSGEYIEAYLLSLYQRVHKAIDVLPLGNKFITNAVDGGAFNNEPIELVERKLSEVCDTTNDLLIEINEAVMANYPQLADKVFVRYVRKEDTSTDMDESNHSITNNDYKAHILIDPFPAFEHSDDKSTTYHKPKTIMAVVGQVLSAFMNQVRVKDQHALSTFRHSDGSNRAHRGMIYPSRRDAAGNKEDYHLATGGLGGFGGFFSKAFRVYDYGLGRADCESFLKNHFTIPVDALSQYASYAQYTDSNLDHLRKNGILIKSDRKEMEVVPIIPNLRKLANIDPYDFDELDFPQLGLASLRKRKKGIRKRIHRLCTRLFLSQLRQDGKTNWKIVLPIVLILAVYTGGVTYALFEQKDAIKFYLFLAMNIVVPVVFYYYMKYALARKVYNTIKADLEKRGQLKTSS